MTTVLTVTHAETLSPTLRRVWFRSNDLASFAGSAHTDRYVKLLFLKSGVRYPDDIDMRVLRATMAAEDLPLVRTYTALYPDVATGTMAIDFVIHGDDGVAGPWAAQASPGQILYANGPGGGYRPDPRAAWHLMVGDESAIPAIRAALEDLPADARAHVVVEVTSAEHEVVLPASPHTVVRFVHRDDPGTGSLTDAVREIEWDTDGVQAFVHGEAGEVMHSLRPLLLAEQGVPAGRLSISGYWRRGRTEEGFRDWKAELALKEQAHDA